VGITIAGLVLGLLVASAATQLVRSSLYGVEPADPARVAGAPLVMTVVAVLSAFFPARRAARLEPLAALRYE